MEYEVKVEGLLDLNVRIRALGAEYRDRILEAVEKATTEAGAYMAMHVPYHSGQLYRAINVGPVVYRPGAAGGGGYYEAHVGVNEEMAPHAIWVTEGTGIYNRENPTNGIFPGKGNVMAFEKLGEGTVFTRWTRGQEPQDAWFENAQDLANAVVRREIMR